jgi:two-component system phosphate regulon sensor histidine kinase PhoR
VRERVVTNIILISLLTLVLIVGVYIVYRNVKREIEIAQIKSDFVSNVSHELRTPLSLISMFAETLELGRAKTEEKKKEYYSIISREANRLGRIVNTILNFSKMEAGKRKYHFEEKDLNRVIEKIFENYSFHLRNKGFKFEYYPGKKLPAIDQRKIFEKFFRVSSALVHNTKGTGLGLSIVRHVMDAHGGRVVLKSKKGVGSSFQLLFPIKSGKN